MVEPAHGRCAVLAGLSSDRTAPRTARTTPLAARAAPWQLEVEHCVVLNVDAAHVPVRGHEQASASGGVAPERAEVAGADLCEPLELVVLLEHGGDPVRGLVGVDKHDSCMLGDEGCLRKVHERVQLALPELAVRLALHIDDELADVLRGKQQLDLVVRPHQLLGDLPGLFRLLGACLRTLPRCKPLVSARDQSVGLVDYHKGIDMSLKGINMSLTRSALPATTHSDSLWML